MHTTRPKGVIDLPLQDCFKKTKLNLIMCINLESHISGLKSSIVYVINQNLLSSGYKLNQPRKSHHQGLSQENLNALSLLLFRDRSELSADLKLTLPQKIRPLDSGLENLTESLTALQSIYCIYL